MYPAGNCLRYSVILTGRCGNSACSDRSQPCFQIMRVTFLCTLQPFHWQPRVLWRRYPLHRRACGFAVLSHRCHPNSLLHAIFVLHLSQLWSAQGAKIGVSAAVGVVPVPKAQMQEKQNWSYLASAKKVVKNAHEPQNEITGLTFSQASSQAVNGVCLSCQVPCHLFPVELVQLPGCYAACNTFQLSRIRRSCTLRRCDRVGACIVATRSLESVLFQPQDGNTLLSRCSDGTLKIWDLRRFTVPVHTFDGLPTNYPTTRPIFSPDERIIATGKLLSRVLCCVI